jgi:hypothetical protein
VVVAGGGRRQDHHAAPDRLRVAALIVKALDPRLRRTLLLAAAVTAFVALGALWLWEYRRGQPVDIDEAGYLGFAVTDYRGLVDGGPGGYWDSVMGPSIQAPLMTALTTPVFLVTGTGILSGLLVPLLLGGVMLLPAYGLGHEVGGPRVGWVAMALTAGTPVVIGFSRSYNFAIASGAATAVMLWAIARSRGFDRVGWSAVAGVAIGLVALSRTLMLAFLPALGVIGLVVLAAGPRRGRRLGCLVLAAVSALAVAGPWYHRNGEAVLDYLTSYGYGRGSTAYGNDQSVLSLDSWRQTAVYVVANSFVPMALLWAGGLVVIVGALVLAVRSEGVLSALRRAARSPLMPSLVWVVWCLAALTSSGNKGTGFLAPLVPAFAVLTAWALWRLPRPTAVALAGVAGVVVALNTVVAMFPTAEWAQPRQVAVPWVDQATVYSGRGVIQGYVAYARPDLPDGQMTVGEARGWHRSVDELTSDLGQLGPGQVFTAFGFRHRLVNVNTVQLEQLLDGGPALPLTMVDPADVPNDEDAMIDYLTTGYAATSCLLLTSRGLAMEIEPVVDADLMSQAAKEAGFVRRTTVPLPDGRDVVVWRRPSSCPVTSGAP